MSKYYAEDELKKMFGGQKSGQKWTDTETALFAPYTDIISKPMSDEYSSMLKGITHRQDEIRQYNESLWKDKKDFDFNITKQDVQKITSEIKAKSKETPYTKVQLLGTSFTIPTEMALSLKGISDILSQAFFSDFAQEAQRESEKNKFTANATELAYKGIKGAFEASQRVLSAPDRINETVERLFKVDENVPRLRATDILTNPGKAMYEGYVTAAAEDNGKFMYHAGNIMEAAGGMVPTLIAGNVLGAAHPVLGKLGSMATIWTTSGASAFDEAQADGKSFWESTAYGMTMGAAEGVLGYFIGGIGTTAKDSTGILGRVLKKPMNALVNATKKVSSSVKVQAAFRVLLNGLADAGSEAIEEGLQETLQNTYQKFIFKKDISWDEGVLTAALYGAVLSSVFNAASMVGSYNTETRQVFEEMGEACKVESDKMFNIMPDLPAEELAQYKQLLETTLGDKTLADIGKIVESRENWIAEVGEENGKYYDDAVKTYERMKTDAATIKLILDKNPLSETEQIKEKIKGKFEPRDLTGTMTEQDVRTAISEVADEIAYLAHTDLDNDIFNQKVIEAQQLKDSADVMGIEIPEGVFSTVVNNIDADPEILKETIRRTSTKPEIPQDASYQEGMQSAKRLQIQGELAKVRSEIEIQKAQADEALRKMNEAAEAVRQDRANKDLLERYKQAKALHDMEQQVRRANERKLKYLIQEEQTLLLPERSSAEAKPEAAAELDVEPEAKPEAVEEVTPEVTPEPAPAQEAGQAEQEAEQDRQTATPEITDETTGEQSFTEGVLEEYLNKNVKEVPVEEHSKLSVPPEVLTEQEIATVTEQAKRNATKSNVVAALNRLIRPKEKYGMQAIALEAAEGGYAIANKYYIVHPNKFPANFQYPARPMHSEYETLSVLQNDPTGIFAKWLNLARANNGESVQTPTRAELATEIALYKERVKKGAEFDGLNERAAVHDFGERMPAVNAQWLLDIMQTLNTDKLTATFAKVQPESGPVYLYSKEAGEATILPIRKYTLAAEDVFVRVPPAEGGIEFKLAEIAPKAEIDKRAEAVRTARNASKRNQTRNAISRIVGGYGATNGHIYQDASLFSESVDLPLIVNSFSIVRPNALPENLKLPKSSGTSVKETVNANTVWGVMKQYRTAKTNGRYVKLPSRTEIAVAIAKENIKFSKKTGVNPMWDFGNVAVNAQTLLDVLYVLNTDSVEAYTGGDVSGLYIISENGEGVIMPISKPKTQGKNSNFITVSPPLDNYLGFEELAEVPKKPEQENAQMAEQEVTQEVKQTEQEVTQEVPQNAPQTERKFKIIDRNDTGTLKLREKVKGSLGVDLLYVDTLGGAEAVYSKSEGIIYVANDTALLPWRQIEKVIMHECVHSLQGTLAYDELIAYTANNRPDLFSKDNIAKTQDVYRRAGIELSEAEATQEIAADFLADILGDMDLINTIAAEAPKTSVGIAGWLRTTLNNLTKTAKKGKDTYIKEVMDYQKRLNKAMEEASKKRANPEQQAEKPKMKTSDEILYSTDPYAYEMQFSITPDPTAEQMKEAIRVAREAVRRYGAIPEGATPLLREGDAIVIDGTQYLYPGMPQKISPKQNVSKFIRTVLESNLVTDRQKGQIIRDTMAGTIGVYQAQANKAVMAYAKNVIAEQGSIESATDFFYEQLKTGKNDSKTMAIGIELLQHYFNNNNMETAEKILGDLIVELTEAGRKVQLGNILKQMSGTGQVYTLQKLVNKLNYHKKPGEQRYYLPDWVASELRQPDLTVEQQQDIYDRATAEIINQIPATWWEKWNQWRYLSMLGNPKTHIRNVLGNAVIIPTIMLKNTIAVPLEVAANVAEVKRLTNLSKEASRATTSQDKLKILSEVERSAEYKSLLTRTVEAFKTESDKMNYLNGIAESLEARIKTGQAIERTKAAIAPTALKKFAKQDALRITELLTVGEKYTQNSLFKVVEQKKIFKTKWLEWIRKKNLDLLEAEDLLFLNYHYSNALAGYLHTNGITAQQAAQAVQELSDGKFTKNTDLYLRAQEYAINEAKKATYRDANSLARTLNKFAKESRGQEVLIEAITPFKATPFNIVKRGVEYSPLGIISAVGKTYNAIAKGTVTPTQAIDSMCAGLSGTAIATVGMYLAAQGLLSGLLGDDKEEKLLRQGGKQSFSVNILGNSYTIDWAAPVCMPLFVGVTLWEGISKGGLSLSETIESGLSILEPVFNLTMLQGINRAISSAKYNDRNPLAAVIVNQLGNYGGQGIPTLFGQIARTMSKERGGTRTAYTGALPTDMQYIVQTWLNKIPGIPRNPYIDLWGETSVDPLWERAATNFLSPGYLETQEPLALKMAELQKRTDESVVPIQPPKKITYLGKEYNLTAAEQVEYGKLIGAAQKEAAIEFIENGKKITVQFNNDKGTRISATVTFEQKDTGKTYGGLYSLDDLKARALKKYMQSAKDKAHAQFMKEYLKR